MATTTRISISVNPGLQEAGLFLIYDLDEKSIAMITLPVIFTETAQR
jgi:hypothetical protein